jgi:hypothetical protein
VGAVTVAASTGLAALLGIGGRQLVIADLLVIGAVAAAGVVTRRRRAGARDVSMAVVPWGVVVDPDTAPRVLRWPAIRRITVDVAHTMHGGTPTVLSSLVTVETAGERLAGQSAGAVGLEGLTVHLGAYAEEATRPVALDLEGREEAGDGATEPVVADLLARAEELCTTGRGAAALALPPGGYRSVASPTAGPETLAILRQVLAADGGTRASPADARPLAAVLAVFLGARALAPEVLRLARSPHPVVAAVGKAAAIRLGAPRNRAGAIDEVAAFLFDADHRLLTAWAEAAPAPAADDAPCLSACARTPSLAPELGT